MWKQVLAVVVFLFSFSLYSESGTHTPDGSKPSQEPVDLGRTVADFKLDKEIKEFILPRFPVTKDYIDNFLEQELPPKLAEKDAVGAAPIIGKLMATRKKSAIAKIKEDAEEKLKQKIPKQTEIFLKKVIETAKMMLGEEVEPSEFGTAVSEAVKQEDAKQDRIKQLLDLMDSGATNPALAQELRGLLDKDNLLKSVAEDPNKGAKLLTYASWNEEGQKVFDLNVDGKNIRMVLGDGIEAAKSAIKQMLNYSGNGEAKFLPQLAKEVAAKWKMEGGILVSEKPKGQEKSANPGAPVDAQFVANVNQLLKNGNCTSCHSMTVSSIGTGIRDFKIKAEKDKATPRSFSELAEFLSKTKNQDMINAGARIIPQLNVLAAQQAAGK